MSLLDDSFFHEELDSGMLFQVRRSNFLSGRRTLNIIDEFEEREKVQRAFEEAEAKRDMSYEEYLGKYQDMIDGKNLGKWKEAGQVSGEGGDATGGPPRSQHASRPVTGHEDAKSDNGSKKAKSNGNKSGLNSMNATKDGFGDYNRNPEAFELPNSCLLSFLKGNKITDLQKSYVLLSHPFPLMDGEMILFQPN